LGKPEQARTLAEDTLTRRRRVLGDDHPDTLRAVELLQWLDGQAGTWYQDAKNATNGTGLDDNDTRLGRPSTPMEVYQRLMFLKCRYRWGMSRCATRSVTQ
jgi:hypothetical protein